MHGTPSCLILLAALGACVPNRVTPVPASDTDALADTDVVLDSDIVDPSDTDVASETDLPFDTDAPLDTDVPEDTDLSPDTDPPPTPVQLTSVSISPASPANDALLTCNATVDDPDGDLQQLSYAWSNVSTAAALGTAPTQQLNSTLAMPGDVIRCEATAQGGASAPTDSATITLINRAPEVDAPMISPAVVHNDSALSCVTSATDPDGQVPSMSYAWLNTTTSQPLGVAASLTLNPSVASPGDAIRCRATASDGVLTAHNDATVTVGNRAPVVSSVSLTPNPLRTRDTATVSAVATDPDGQAVSLSFSWHVEGSFAGNGDTLDPSWFVKGDAVTVEVLASDGDEITSVSGGPWVVANTAPTTPGIALSPEDPRPDEGLRCEVVSPSFDPDVDDGVDTVAYDVTWDVDGSPFTGVSNLAGLSEVHAEDTETGEVWTCSVTARDGDEDSVAAVVSVTVLPPQPGDPRVTDWLGTMRYIPAGSFQQGCQVGRDTVDGATCQSSWQPVHTTNLNTPFWMMEEAVTQEMWMAFAAANPSEYDHLGGDHPVERVTWYEAAYFANLVSIEDGLTPCYNTTGCAPATSLGSGLTCGSTESVIDSVNPYTCSGYRLPTEAEREYATRAGDGFAYSGSNDVGDVAWYSGNTTPSTTRAGCQLDRNAWQLCDLSGNVNEWMWDSVRTYSGVTQTNPRGADNGFRGIRGGAYLSGASFSRAASRSSRNATSQQSSLGFRLVRRAE